MAKTKETVSVPIPAGESFSINGTSYHIRPRLFSSKLMRKLSAVVKSKRRDIRKNQLEGIKDLKDVLPASELRLLCETFLKDELDRVSVDYATAAEAIQDAEGDMLAMALEACCEDIRDQEHAQEVIDEHGNSMAIAMLILKAGQDDLTSSGNLGSLLLQMGEDQAKQSA